jgi:hypothetical protein
MNEAPARRPLIIYLLAAVSLAMSFAAVWGGMAIGNVVALIVTLVLMFGGAFAAAGLVLLRPWGWSFTQTYYGVSLLLIYIELCSQVSRLTPTALIDIGRIVVCIIVSVYMYTSTLQSAFTRRPQSAAE